MLDLRFVFVLRCLYRQGEKNLKPNKSADLAVFLGKNEQQIKIISEICKYQRIYTKSERYLQHTPRKEGNAHAKKHQRNHDCIKSGPDNNGLG